MSSSSHDSSPTISPLGVRTRLLSEALGRANEARTLFASAVNLSENGSIQNWNWEEAADQAWKAKTDAMTLIKQAKSIDGIDTLDSTNWQVVDIQEILSAHESEACAHAATLRNTAQRLERVASMFENWSTLA